MSTSAQTHTRCRIFILAFNWKGWCRREASLTHCRHTHRDTHTHTLKYTKSNCQAFCFPSYSLGWCYVCLSFSLFLSKKQQTEIATAGWEALNSHYWLSINKSFLDFSCTRAGEPLCEFPAGPEMSKWVPLWGGRKTGYHISFPFIQ